MAERKAVNHYYPPDFDPAKHRNINKYHNTHPLRERAKKLSQGILVIRFEMPYNIWCGGCGNHVGMGVRYNAEKKKVGNYYTTPIYRFRMKCHLCDNYIEMETDPKNFDYAIISGARRKNQKWDMEENEQVLTEDREAVKKLARDAMYKLEHGVDDTKKLKKAAPSLSQIAEIQSAKRDDYNQNQALRSKFRGEKKQLLAVEASNKALLAKSSLDIELVPEAEEDKKLASLLRYSASESYEEKRQHKRETIQSQDIFAASTVSSPPSGESSPMSSTSSSSKASRHSDAHKTLVDQVLKKRSPGAFGAFAGKVSPSGSVGSSMGKTAKLLIGGTTGFVVTRKRKRSDEHGSLEIQAQKRKRMHTPEVRSPGAKVCRDTLRDVVKPSSEANQISKGDKMHPEYIRTECDESENETLPTDASILRSAISENSGLTGPDTFEQTELRLKSTEVEGGARADAYPRKINSDNDDDLECAKKIDSVDSTLRRRISDDGADKSDVLRRRISGGDEFKSEGMKSCDPKLSPCRLIEDPQACHSSESVEKRVRTDASQSGGDLSTSPSTSREIPLHITHDHNDGKEESSANAECERNSISLVSNYSSSESDSDEGK